MKVNQRESKFQTMIMIRITFSAVLTSRPKVYYVIVMPFEN